MCSARNEDRSARPGSFSAVIQRSKTISLSGVTSTKRDRTKLCVVETPADILAIEHTHSFQGLYFVLHGRLSPLDGIGPQEIGIPHLLNHIKEQAIKELIIATNPTMEGRATAHYIVSHLEDTPITCTQLAHGIPLGGELEYLDGGTLAHALQQRTTIE